MFGETENNNESASPKALKLGNTLKTLNKYLHMKKFYIILLWIISLIFLQNKSYGQNPYFDFDYERSNRTSVIVDSHNIDSLTRMDKVVLEGFDFKVPFYHFLNERNSDNSYVILLHGLGGNKDYWVNPSLPYLQYTKNLTAIKDTLLDLGFNVVIPDAKYHGERSYELNFRNPGSMLPGRSKSQADADSFYNLYASTIKEIRLIMDYVEDISKESKTEFNLIGYSMGGMFSLILNTVDERINCVVACVAPLALPFSEIEELNWSGEISEKMKAISPFYSATDQKSPVAMLMGMTDHFIPVDEARDFYKQIPIDDKKLKLYDSGHILPTEYIYDVISWITKHNKE